MFVNIQDLRQLGHAFKLVTNDEEVAFTCEVLGVWDCSTRDVGARAHMIRFRLISVLSDAPSFLFPEQPKIEIASS